MKNVTPKELKRMSRIALRPVTVIGEQVGLKMTKGETSRMLEAKVTGELRVWQDIARRLADAILEPVAYFTRDGTIVELVQPTSRDKES